MRARVPWPAAAICLVPLSFPVEQLGAGSFPVPVIQLAILAGVGLVWIDQLRRREPLIVASPILVALGLVVLSALVSTIGAVDPAGAARLDVGYVLGLALAAATGVSCADPGHSRLLIACLCLVGLGICLEGVITTASLTPHYGGALVENRAMGIFGQPNELGAFAALIVVLSVAWFLSFTGWSLLRVLAGASVVASVGAVALSLSRGAWIGLVLGFGVLLVLAPQVRRRLLATLTVVAAAVGATLVVHPGLPMLSLLGTRAVSVVDGQRNPYDFRYQIWAEAGRQFEARPWLGAGPGGYEQLAGHTPSQVTRVAPQHAHNLAVTLAAEQGLVGVVAVGVAVFVAIRAITRAIGGPRPRPPGPAGGATGRDRTLLGGVVAALAVALGQGVIDYPLRNAVLATMVWLLLGLLAALVSRRADPPRPDGGVWVVVGRPLVLPVAAPIRRRLDD